jgi:hypothetical protein
MKDDNKRIYVRAEDHHRYKLLSVQLDIRMQDLLGTLLDVYERGKTTKSDDNSN